MKTFYTLAFLVASALGFSQTIPNGGFEYWNTASFQDPVNYPMTSNFEAYNRGLPANATRVTDAQHLTYAINLLTISNSTDTMFGYFVNGDPGNMSGGIPMNQIPTALTGYYKCSVPAGDTAIFLLVFKAGGMPIGQIIYPFTGTQSTYAQFTIPVSLPGNPDTVILGAASSNAFQWQGIPGSMLQIDNLVFTGVSNQPSQLNGSFENWVSTTMYYPAQLTALGDTSFRTTDAYAGNYAIKLTTTSGGNQANQSAVTNGQFTNNGVQGGRPYTSMQDTICGYYKYLVNGVDSAALWINLTNNGNPVGGIYAGLPPVSVYTYFEYPLTTGSPPDTLLFFAGSSFNNTTMANIGSRLYLDDVRLKSQPVSVPPMAHWKNSLRIYPNPAQGQTRVEWNNGMKGNITLRISDLNGKCIREISLPASLGYHSLDLNSLEVGTYFIGLISEKGEITRKLIVTGID